MDESNETGELEAIKIPRDPKYLRAIRVLTEAKILSRMAPEGGSLVLVIGKGQRQDAIKVLTDEGVPSEKIDDAEVPKKPIKE